MVETAPEAHPTLGVVVPALNAATTVAAVLDAVRAHRGPLRLDLVVVDGGSSDATVALAEAHGARVVRAPRGRGTQLAAGAAEAKGDWLLFLHADTVPDPGWASAVTTLIGRADGAGRAGYFRFALDDRGAGPRRVERLVALRCRLFALPYGDQGLVLSRALYDTVGGFRPLPIMEDVDLVRRLGRRRLLALPAAATTSSVRYRTGPGRAGYWVRPLRNLACLALWFLGVPPRLIRRVYG